MADHPLVYLHGWGLHGGIWSETATMIPGLTPDLPGYGNVPSAVPYNAESLADALAATLPRVANRSVAVREEGQEVVFLHRIVDGGADRSYGIHVAALAGLPAAVVARARELLSELEAQVSAPAIAPAIAGASREAGAQLPLLAAPEEVLLRELAEVDPDGLTPRAALQRLYELRAAARRRLAIEG